MAIVQIMLTLRANGWKKWRGGDKGLTWRKKTMSVVAYFFGHSYRVAA